MNEHHQGRELLPPSGNKIKRFQLPEPDIDVPEN